MSVTKHYQSILFAVLVALCIGTNGCNTAYKAGASKQTIQNDKCAEAWLPYPAQPHPMWLEVNKDKVKITSNTQLPTKYQVYKVDMDTLSVLFESAKAGEQFAMVVPAGADCETYMMQQATKIPANDPGARPGNSYFKGNGQNNLTSELKIAWDKKELRGQITYNGALFGILPVTTTDGPAYLFFNAVDMPLSKMPLPVEKVERVKEQKVYDR